MIAIAIDDEPIALNIVREHAQKVPFISVEGYFTNAFEGINYLQHNKVDLIFLDIKMPDISGIDFMNSLVNPPMVVFTTAYSEHAVKSFELNAVDYLLKPFSLARFLKACNKARELYDLRSRPSSDIAESIFIKDGYEQIKVAINDILFLEASGNYIKLHLSNNTSLSTRNTINEIMLMLPAKNFVRIHRAYVVALNKITKFDRYQVYINSHVVPIGATYSQFLHDIK